MKKPLGTWQQKIDVLHKPWEWAKKVLTQEELKNVLGER